MTEASQSKRKPDVVYAIVKNNNSGKKHWLKVGAAFKNRDGSTNVYLDAMPRSGELQIREDGGWKRDRGKESRGDPGNEPW